MLCQDLDIQQQTKKDNKTASSSSSSSSSSLSSHKDQMHTNDVAHRMKHHD